MTETEVAFAPTRLGARRRRVPPVAVGVAIAALLAIAVAKPWGDGPERAATASASAGASTAAATATASGAPGSPIGSPNPIAAAPTPIGFPGPPRPGAWGISLGLDAPGDATGAWASWTAWVPLDPVSERPEPPIRDPLPMETDCASVPTLAAAPSILGITVPEAMSTDFSVLGWLSNGPWMSTLDEELARLDVPGSGQVASLARRDGLTFPDGRYELHLLTSDHVTALGFCLDSDAPPAAAAAGLDQATTARIVSGLAGRSGAWGVGSGGLGAGRDDSGGVGPRISREGPWTDWVAVEPLTGPGRGIGVWPGTGVCTRTPVLLRRPSLVAISVPAGLVPDWRVAAWWSDGPHIVSLDGSIRQISPPGNRGISYLERVDRSDWPDGRYEFRITAGDHVTSLTACIGSP